MWNNSDLFNFDQSGTNESDYSELNFTRSDFDLNLTRNGSGMNDYLGGVNNLAYGMLWFTGALILFVLFAMNGFA